MPADPTPHVTVAEEDKRAPAVAGATADPVARLILDELDNLGPASGPVVVLDDVGGQLTTALLAHQHLVRTHCDDLRDERSLPANASSHPLGPELFSGARTVVARLPKSLSTLDEWAELISAHGAPQVRFLAGARVKHMTRSMNATLEAHFHTVSASLGRNKSRALHASQPRNRESAATSMMDRPTWPNTATLDVLGEATTVVAHGAVFAGISLDAGTRLLLQTLNDHHFAPSAALDFGCGSGLISTWLARRGHTVTAVDVSAAACASTTATLAANGLPATVLRADGLATVASASMDLIVSNPPFHRRTCKDSTPTLEMIDQSARVLRPGGQLWLVYNAHLPYLQLARSRFDQAKIIARDRHYLVLGAH